MKLARVAAVAAAIALVGGSVVAAVPASAANATFVNPLATAATDNLDVTSIDVSFTAQKFSVTAHVQNPPAGDRTFAAYLTSAPAGFLDPSTAAYAAGKQVVGGASSDVGAYKPAGAATGSPTVPNGLVTTENGGVVSVSFDSASIPWAGPVYVSFGYLNPTQAFAAQAAAGSMSYIGFGPVQKDPTPTTIALAATDVTQKYGAAPVTVTATVTPSTATGTITILDDGKPITVVVPTNGVAVYTLPTTLGQGSHSLTASFTPTDATLYAASTTTPVPIAVTGTKSTFTASLSKKSQTYKKTAAKVSVTVSKKLAGTVRVYDGEKKLKSIKVKKGAGAASYTVSKKLPKGTHKLRVTFTPTKPSYGIMTKTLTLKVKK